MTQRGGAVATPLCSLPPPLSTLLVSYPPCPCFLPYSLPSFVLPSLPPFLALSLFEVCGEGVQLDWLDGREAKFYPKTQYFEQLDYILLQQMIIKKKKNMKNKHNQR